MASDEIINEIWEIAQENSLDPIDKEEFGRDLKKSVFAELEHATEGTIFDINNEFARTLPIILHQAKANPDLIYENNGKGFSVASGILAKAVLTVKYENRFIPGTVEYQKEFPKEIVSEVVFTAVIADNLLKNYDDLSKEDKLLVNDNWDKLTTRQRAEVFDKELKDFLERPDISPEDREIVENVRNVSADTDRAVAAIDELEPDARDEFSELYIKRYCKAYPEKIPDIESLRKNNTPYQIFKILDAERVDLQSRIERDFVELPDGSRLSSDHVDLINRYKDTTLDCQIYLKDAYEMFERKGMLEPNVFDFKTDTTVRRTVSSYAASRIDNVRSAVNNIIEINPSFDLDGYLQRANASRMTSKLQSENRASTTIEATEEIYDTVESLSEHSVIVMINSLSEDEIADLFGDELKDLLRKKAEELGISEEDKKTLEAMIASKDDDSFADLFYDDREGFLQELEKMSLLQHAKKQPVTDQEYGPTYRANAEEMVVDSKGLYKAQTDYKKYNEYDGTGTGEGSDDSTSGTTVVQDNDTLEVDTINTHQPVTNSFINTARREDTDKDGKDLKDERDGGGLEDLPPENDLPDNAAPNNSAKNANFISAAKNMRATTDVMQEMGNITTIKVKEMDKKQDGPEVGDESDTIQPGEIE